MSDKPTITMNRKINHTGTSYTISLPKNWVESRLKESGLDSEKFCENGVNILQFNDKCIIIINSLKKNLEELKNLIETDLHGDNHD